jgi:hypothetical protein
MCCGGPSQAPHNTSSFIIGNADLVAQVRAELAGGVAHGSTAQRSAGRGVARLNGKGLSGKGRSGKGLRRCRGMPSGPRTHATHGLRVRPWRCRAEGTRSKGTPRVLVPRVLQGYSSGSCAADAFKAAGSGSVAAVRAERRGGRGRVLARRLRVDEGIHRRCSRTIGCASAPARARFAAHRHTRRTRRCQCPRIVVLHLTAHAHRPSRTLVLSCARTNPQAHARTHTHAHARTHPLTCVRLRPPHGWLGAAMARAGHHEHHAATRAQRLRRRAAAARRARRHWAGRAVRRRAGAASDAAAAASEGARRDAARAASIVLCSRPRLRCAGLKLVAAGRRLCVGHLLWSICVVFCAQDEQLGAAEARIDALSQRLDAANERLVSLGQPPL